MRVSGQQGMVLWLVLPFVAVLSVLAVESSKLILLEQRASIHLQVRQKLDHMARQALSLAEQQVLQLDRMVVAQSQGGVTVWYQDGKQGASGGGWFRADCHIPAGEQYRGLCQPQRSIWQQTTPVVSGVVPLLHPEGYSRVLVFFPCRTRCTSDYNQTRWAWSQPRYVVELVDPAFRLSHGGAEVRLYRITLRIWGILAQYGSTWQSWWVTGEGVLQGRRLSVRKIADEM